MPLRANFCMQRLTHAAPQLHAHAPCRALRQVTGFHHTYLCQSRESGSPSYIDTFVNHCFFEEGCIPARRFVDAITNINSGLY